MTQCIVCDIDGTIAHKMPTTVGHGAWEKAIVERPPKPIIPMRTLLQSLAQNFMVHYATARREATRSLTLDWLKTNAFPFGDVHMRPDDLRLSQDMLKLRYLKQMREAGWQPIVWFEDDPATIEVLRGQGVHAIAC
jgi:hypothetical protein